MAFLTSIAHAANLCWGSAAPWEAAPSGGREQGWEAPPPTADDEGQRALPGEASLCWGSAAPRDAALSRARQILSRSEDDDLSRAMALSLQEPQPDDSSEDLERAIELSLLELPTGCTAQPGGPPQDERAYVPDELLASMARATGGVIDWEAGGAIPEEDGGARVAGSAVHVVQRETEVPQAAPLGGDVASAGRDAQAPPQAPRGDVFQEVPARGGASDWRRPWPLPCWVSQGRAPQTWRSGALEDVEDAWTWLYQLGKFRTVRRGIFEAASWKDLGRVAVASRSACCMVASSCSPDKHPADPDCSRRRLLSATREDRGGRAAPCAPLSIPRFGEPFARALARRLRDSGAVFGGSLHVDCRKGIVTWGEGGLDGWRLFYDDASKDFRLRFQGHSAKEAHDLSWGTDHAFVSFWRVASDATLAAFCMGEWYGGRAEVVHVEGAPCMRALG
uniref:Uncharacterized protein n=1 Tax=Alexandrium monilatum TaxID=311494 RepID=A0A7S4VWD6_9DINO